MPLIVIPQRAIQYRQRRVVHDLRVVRTEGHHRRRVRVVVNHLAVGVPRGELIVVAEAFGHL